MPEAVRDRTHLLASVIKLINEKLEGSGVERAHPN